MNFETFSFPALILISVTSITIFVGRDWRLILSALGIQFVGVFILVGLTWPLEMAVIKLVTGWISAAVLGMELVSSQNGYSPTPLGFSARLFRIFIAVLIGFSTLSLVPEMANWVLNASYEQLLGSLLLAGMGILHLGVTDSPFRVAVGLLTVLSGFEIIYAAVDTSVLVAGFFALLAFGISLLGSYLMAALTFEVDR